MSTNNVSKILKLIDNILLDKPNLKTFDLAFFGGEPLMYYSKVTRPIIDYYRTKYDDYKNINFEVSFTSNGYLLSDTILNHLTEKKEYKHFDSKNKRWKNWSEGHAGKVGRARDHKRAGGRRGFSVRGIHGCQTYG